MRTRKEKPPRTARREIKKGIPFIDEEWGTDRPATVRADMKTKKSKMRTEKQVRAEMEHQKKLLSKAPNDYLQQKYQTRVYFASWVLGDSDSF